MKLYDIMCPVCGAMNRRLDLEETHNWYVCDGCQCELFAFTPDMKMTETSMLAAGAKLQTKEVE